MEKADIIFICFVMGYGTCMLGFGFLLGIGYSNLCLGILTVIMAYFTGWTYENKQILEEEL